MNEKMSTYRDQVIFEIAEKLREQKVYEVKTYLEIKEEYGEKTDPYMLKCFYPDRHRPGMLSVYVKIDDVQMVGRREDIADYHTEYAEINREYRGNLVHLRINEALESSHTGTIQIAYEIMDHISKKHGWNRISLNDNGYAISKDILARREDLVDGIEHELNGIPVEITKENNRVLVLFQELLICGVVIEEHSYKLYNISSEWIDESTYLCEEETNGMWCAYIDTIDECIGECKRLVMFEAKKSGHEKETQNELSEQFEKRFLKGPGVSTGAIYEIYAAAAKELWKRYADKYELRPRSVANARKGTNGGIEFYRDGRHLVGISVGKTTTLYVHDTYLRSKLPLNYNQDNRGQYRYTFGTFEECLEKVKDVL